MVAGEKTSVSMSDPAIFGQLNSAIDQYLTGGRKPNAALLLWFLVHVKRFDLVEAEDAIAAASRQGNRWSMGRSRHGRIGLCKEVLDFAHRDEVESDVIKLAGAAIWSRVSNRWMPGGGGTQRRS